MMKIIPFTVTLCLLIASMCAAQTVLTPPVGWTRQNAGEAIIFMSPGNESARPALTFFPPGRPQGDVKNWFGNQALTVARALGKPMGATEITQQEGIFLRVVQIESVMPQKV